jgi:outer membrane protein assembly factor BamE
MQKIIIISIFTITLTSCIDTISKNTKKIAESMFTEGYKGDIHQGFDASKEQIDKIQLGISKTQVKKILGSPDIIDPFHKNRWDYINTSRINNKTISKSLTLFFDENNTLKDGEYKWKD